MFCLYFIENRPWQVLYIKNTHMRKITVDKMNTILLFMCIALRTSLHQDVTLVVNSAQAPLRHPGGSA